MARTRLFGAVRRLLRLARLSAAPGGPPPDEIIEIYRPSRRRVLQASAALGLGVIGCGGAPPAALPVRGAPPRVVIVGGGIAGLTAAYRLKQAGVAAPVYEAQRRVGGRMFTARDLLAPGGWVELGGEFIDSGHEEIRRLVAELGLELLDGEGASEAGLTPEAYFFGGAMRTEAEVVAAFVPVAARMKADADALDDVIDFQHEGKATALDRTSIAEYLGKLGAARWLHDLLLVAFVTEYGLDAGEQSALNLLLLIGTDVSDGRFRIFGESDERYRVAGGNQRVPEELARRLEGQLRLEHALRAVSPRGEGLRLDFAGPGGEAVEVDADVAVIALPYTLLRDVEIRLDMPAVKRRAIAELGYGTNAKVLVGLTRRVWREQRFGGNIFSDEPFQLAWDHSRLQPGAAGGLTLFSGGRAGVECGAGTAEEQAARLLPGLNKAYPGVVAAQTGKVSRMHWPSFPHTRGSYACYRPGQWTTIKGAETMPVGPLLFAGEHCSADFQGYMNGGAETGAAAAQAVLDRIDARRSKIASAAGSRRDRPSTLDL